MKKYWDRFLHWSGWKAVFPLPFWILIPLFAACGIALIYVFLKDLAQWWPAYILYVLSAYCLTALCVKLPAALRGGRVWMDRHPRITGIMRDRQQHFVMKLYFEQFLNFAYGIFKILSGVIIGSAWIGCDGIYNFTQALIQLFQILRRRKANGLTQQWKAYRFCGWLVLLMHLTIIGIVFQMVNWNRVEDSGEIMIIATAAFAFYKFISSFIELARDRKHTRPVDSSVRMLELSQAIFAMLSLQTGLLHIYGTGESWEHWLNLATGCAVCLLTVAMGIYMIRRANREIKDLQEKEYGE